MWIEQIQYAFRLAQQQYSKFESRRRKRRWRSRSITNNLRVCQKARWGSSRPYSDCGGGSSRIGCYNCSLLLKTWGKSHALLSCPVECWTDVCCYHDRSICGWVIPVDCRGWFRWRDEPLISRPMLRCTWRGLCTGRIKKSNNLLLYSRGTEAASHHYWVDSHSMKQ